MQRSLNKMWIPVVGYENRYEVSDDGRVRSIFRPGVRGKQGGHIMKLRTTAFE